MLPGSKSTAWTLEDMVSSFQIAGAALKPPAAAPGVIAAEVMMMRPARLFSNPSIKVIWGRDSFEANPHRYLPFCKTVNIKERGLI
ncbi:MULTISPECIES: hypothetical protein [Agrobacterium]|uniref:hypothetical protein n=1 Tax=Agrobacterium TaxID=357 RepID=UPI000555FAB3|nr:MULTISPECIES: hypothetical protein [Agrobacterium]